MTAPPTAAPATPPMLHSDWSVVAKVVTLFVGLVALFVNPPTTVNGGPDA